MCGITGFVEPRTSSEDRQQERIATVRAMLDTLRHRGPDGDGTYVDDHCSLGHVRLKVIDLSDAAAQPMRGESAVLAFNGEIYNFRALRAELGAEVELRTSSDTEVLLRGYEAWGLDVFRRANGMFAAAIWDTRARKLVLARDRLGKKPLYYYADPHCIVFASELKAVLRHPRVRVSLDDQSLAQYFAFSYIPTPRTIFQRIHKVPQGSYVVFEDGRCETVAYWELPADERERTENDALDELDHLLRDATRIRLESDVPLGFFLSGGIDSTLVTAIGKQLAGDIRTFTVGFRDRDHDEAPYARAIASHLGTRHTELYLDDRDFGAFMSAAPRFFDEPFADSSLLPTYFLSRATREHVTVALTGDGGDELFCGYQKYKNLGQLAPTLRLPRAMRELAARLLDVVPTNTTRKAGDAMHATTLEEVVRWLVSTWKPAELARLMPDIAFDWPTTQFQRTWQRFAARDVLTRFMAADIKSYLCDDILQKVDRASMAVALEVRSPLLDYRVVELAVRLPRALKVRFGRSKHLLRKLLARYVPRGLWERRKHGFNVPVQAWYRGARRTHLERAVERLESRFPTLSASSMRHVMHAHFSSRYDYGHKLFALDMLDEWAREHLVT